MILTREQLALIAKQTAKSVKQAKAIQMKQTKQRKGYVRALPMNPLTPKASESRWALLAKGTESTRQRNVSHLDAKPKNSLADARLIRDYANVPDEDKLYVVPSNATNVELVVELLRIKLVRHLQAHELAQVVHMSSKEHQNLRRALTQNKLDIVEKILNRTIKANQVR